MGNIHFTIWCFSHARAVPPRASCACDTAAGTGWWCRAQPCLALTTFFWALTPLKQDIYVPSTSCSVGLGKQMAELKLIVNPLGNNEVMEKGLKLTKGASSLPTRSGHRVEVLIPTSWSFCWACQDCVIICGHCPLSSLGDSCFNASHTFWLEFWSGTIPHFSDGTLQEMHFRHC